MDQLFNLSSADQTLFLSLGLIVVLLAILLAALRFVIGQRKWYGFGKILGFLLGYFIARAPGALLGLLFGHAFDLLIQPKHSKQYTPPVIPAEGVKAGVYTDTLFAVLGNFLHVNEQVTSEQLNQVHILTQQLQLSENSAHQAWEWFQYGQHKEFNVRQALFALQQYAVMDAQAMQTLMQQVIHFAEKNQPLNLEQYTVLCYVAHALHFSTENFAHLQVNKEKMENLVDNEVIPKNPYKLLELSSAASNKEIKWAYRKLMAKYHPDKLISKNLPEDLLQLATQRTQQIKEAYEKICQERGI